MAFICPECNKQIVLAATQPCGFLDQENYKYYNKPGHILDCPSCVYKFYSTDQQYLDNCTKIPTSKL